MDTLISIMILQITGGIIWYTFFFGHSLMDRERREKLFNIIGADKLNGYKRKKVILIYLTLGLLQMIVLWEVSLVNTVKKSYKHWI